MIYGVYPNHTEPEMNQSVIKNKYLIRPDLHWDKLFDGAVLLRWGNNGHIVKSQSATGLLDFLNHFSGGPFELNDLNNFQPLEKPLKQFIEKELLRRTEDVLGNFKMPEWYSKIAVSLPNANLKFMNHGYAELPSDDLSWIRPEDWDERYQVNLVHHLTKMVSLKDKKILDIGCGRGGAASYIARYHDASEVVGLDFCDESIELCRRIHDGIQGLKFKQGDAQNLPFKSDKFDVITNIESSHCYAAPKIFFKEVYRVLKNGGYFCYTDCFPVAPRFSLISNQLEEAGFTVNICLDITPNVIAAIEQGQESLAKLLRESKSDGKETDNEAEHWYKGVFRQYDLYKKGFLKYMLWNLIKK